MASIDRTWESAGVAVEVTPARDASVRDVSFVRSRIARESQLARIFNYVLMLYLFAYAGRIPEIIPWFHVGLILEPILLIGLVLTDRVRSLLEVRTGRWLIGFAVWVGLCVPFSYWPGGSFATFVVTLRAVLLVAFIVAFVRSVEDVMRAFITIGLATGIIAIVSLVSPEQAGMANRAAMADAATLGDPNYFALYLVVGVALLCLTASRTRGWTRICSLVLIPINLAGLLRSGSRAGIVTLTVGLIMLLVYGSAKQRTAILSAALVGVLLAVTFLPNTVRDRFTEWMAPTGLRALTTGQLTQVWENGPDVSAAESSTEARLYLLRRSLIMTAKHPILGVGPDQFQVAEAADAGEQGIRGAWHTTHNTYTLMSSEAGIPGLILFTGALFGSYRGLSRLRKRGPTRHIRQMAMFFQTAYLMLMVGAFFLSLGYSGLPFALIGLSGAFKLAVRRYIRESGASVSNREVSVAFQPVSI